MKEYGSNFREMLPYHHHHHKMHEAGIKKRKKEVQAKQGHTMHEAGINKRAKQGQGKWYKMVEAKSSKHNGRDERIWQKFPRNASKT